MKTWIPFAKFAATTALLALTITAHAAPMVTEDWVGPHQPFTGGEDWDCTKAVMDQKKCNLCVLIAHEPAAKAKETIRQILDAWKKDYSLPGRIQIGDLHFKEAVAPDAVHPLPPNVRQKVCAQVSITVPTEDWFGPYRPRKDNEWDCMAAVTDGEKCKLCVLYAKDNQAEAEASLNKILGDWKKDYSFTGSPALEDGRSENLAQPVTDGHNGKASTLEKKYCAQVSFPANKKAKGAAPADESDAGTAGITNAQ